MKKLHKAILAGGVSLAVLVPAASAFAAGYGPGNGAGNGDRGNGTCTCDPTHDRTADQIQVCDGTADRPMDGTGSQYGHGEFDGSGDGTADRPMDGTGSQWRAGR